MPVLTAEQLHMGEVLRAVSFDRDREGELVVRDVKTHVTGTIHGNANMVLGDIKGPVYGSINGPVFGMVHGKINQREWQFVETNTERAVRLIREGKYEEAIELIEENQ